MCSFTPPANRFQFVFSTLRIVFSNHFKSKHYRTLSQFPEQNEKQKNHKTNEKYTSRSVLLGSAATGILGYYFLVNEKQQRHAYAAKNDSCRKGAWRADLPTYTKEDVRKHSTQETRIWVSFREGVYDITDYISEHPGGLQIMLGAGSNLEAFWRLYGFHELDFILGRLEKLRIGNLKKCDQVLMTDFPDPYEKEPQMHRDTEPVITKPYCGGVKLHLLADNFYTPNEYFYVRNHLPVPQVDLKSYEFELEVEGTDRKMTFTLDDIKKLPKVTITATLMCTGNRRTEMMKVVGRKMAVLWGANAMSNAKWTGVRLRDLLKMVDITEDECRYKHVQFEGIDREANGVPYGASIPIWKAVDKYGDVLLAYEMNGVPLPPIHGYPLRLIIPGHTGARSVKWLAKIIVSMEESACHYQQIDYKAFSPSTTWKTADYKSAPAIQDIPVISAICRPTHGDCVEVKDGRISLKGYAHSGGGRKIMRVDLTADGGQTWQVAKLKYQDSALPPHNWAWTLWTAEIPVDKNLKEVEIWCKAVDSSFNTQPETFENIFNFKGCLNNAYHRVKVKLNQ